MQNSRNTYIHIKQNIFALKALFYIQQLYIYAASRNCIYSTSRKWYTYLVSRKSEILSNNIYLFTRSIIIRGNCILSRNYIHFKELISSFKEIYPRSRKTYSFREIKSIQGNILIKKHMFVKVQGHMFIQGTVFTEHYYVRGNIYSNIVPSHFMIIISFAITISWIKYSYNSFRLKDDEIVDMIEGSVL